MHYSALEQRQFDRLAGSWLSRPELQQMRTFRQHGGTSTYDHSLRVARLSFWLNRRLRLNAEEDRLVAAALLHDCCLYDWHDKADRHRWHGFRHPAIAADNARSMGAEDRVCRAVKSHMWPLTLRSVPTSREAWLVCAADKLSAAGELLTRKGR